MPGVLSSLVSRALAPWRKRQEPLDEGALRAMGEAHAARCLNFKLLLSANNSALATMAEMEEALMGPGAYSGRWVRAQSARVCADVLRMATRLEGLLQQPQPVLLERVRSVDAEMAKVLAPAPRDMQGPLTLDMAGTTLAEVHQTGPKAANLGEAASALGLRIPEGFVVTATAYRRFLEHNGLYEEIERRIQATEAERPDQMFSLCSALQQLVIRSPLPEDLAEEILDRFDELEGRTGAPCRLAVRSSSLSEDLADASFAGQYKTELNVGRDDLLHTYKEVVAANFGVPAMTYRLQRGFLDEDATLCVICIRMVEARAGGVAYSRSAMDPEDDAVHISAAPGLPKSVVDGAGPCDSFRVVRDAAATVEQEIAHKPSKAVCCPEGGVGEAAVDARESSEPCLGIDEARAVAEMVLRIEAHFGVAQDVEFALDHAGQPYLLQCRPLRQADPAPAAPEEAAAVQPGETGGERTPEEPEPLLRGGVTASPGAAAGRVFHLLREADVILFPAGAVAVARQALPRWAAVLDRASAVITEQGNVVGHLANVAREFRVPALLGLPEALDTLAPDALVTLDAKRGMVFAGELEAVLTEDADRPSLMEGSPVQQMLSGVLAHIAPLTLLDPDSPDFAAEKCTTLHDVTRFCHELAVRSMFERNDQGLARHASRQLYLDGPMQYWIVDLGDGVDVRAEGKYVRFEYIRSGPMLALWEGMTAVPPQSAPLDARGFLSVLAEAASNPDLEAARSSAFATKNCFLVSRDYCCLQSRFGFHFCTVEALTGDDPVENYASFQFKGGAADLDRRRLRAELIRDILEPYGFLVDVRRDALFARIEGLERAAMDTALKVLGHLIIHTRQLDMAMANVALVGEQRRKLEKELEAIAPVSGAERLSNEE